MPNQIHIMFFISLIAAFIYVASGVSNYIQNKQNNIKYMYFSFMLIMAIWATSLALMNTSSNPKTAIFWRNFGVVFWILTYPTGVSFYYIALKNFFGSTVKRNLVYLSYIPSFIYIYMAYFIFPYKLSDVKLTHLGWVYINRSPNYNIDHYFFSYIAIYAIIFFAFSYKYYAFTNLKRQKISIIQLVISTAITLIIGTFTDIISAEIEGLYLLPLSNVVMLLIPLFIHRSFKTSVFTDLQSPQLIKESTRYISEAIILTKPDHAIGYANDILKTYFSLDDLNSLSDYKFPDDIEKLNSNAERLILDLDTKNIQKIENGQVYYYEYKESKIKDAYNDTLSINYIIRDVTELKRTQNDLLHSKIRLENMVELRTKELKSTTVALKNYNINLQNEIEQRQAVEARVSFLAYHDSLTECYNRNRFIMILKDFLNGTNKSYVYAHIDIRNFKMINDNFGRDTGDVYIKTMAELLQINTPKDTLICRLGGDEFGLFFKQYHTVEDAQKGLDQLFITLGEQILYHNLNMPLYFAGGIAIYPDHSNNLADLLYQAELAMIEAKSVKENNHVIYQPAFHDAIKKQLDMVDAINHALEHQHFKVYYQPQVKSIEDDIKIVGVEALIRWVDPIKGFIPPGEFIPIAERSNQIIKLGQFVLKQSLIDMGRLKNDYGKLLSLAINVSVNQFSDKQLVDILAEYSKKYDIPPDKIEIELTERLLVNASTFSNSTLQAIKDLGVQVTIDDFGVEYSSLNYLKRLPIDKIKIDMSFVHGIGTNPKDEVILETMVDLSEKLNLSILSEGIETEEQFEFLDKTSAQMAYQGYFFHKPVPLERLLEPEILDKMIDA